MTTIKNVEKLTYVTALTYAIENGNLPAEIAEKLIALRTQQEKRNTGEKKPTAKQVSNSAVQSEILDTMEVGKLYTITDLIKTVPACAELTNQRVSAIVRQMVGAEVERVEEKRKAYFRKVEA